MYLRDRPSGESVQHCVHPNPGTCTLIHSRNCDILELCQRLLHGKDINKVIAKYPELKSFHGTRLGCYHDVSSSGDLEVGHVNCYQQ